MYKTQNTHIILSTYEVNDKMRWEILIGIGILFLLIAIGLNSIVLPLVYVKTKNLVLCYFIHLLYDLWSIIPYFMAT